MKSIFYAYVAIVLVVSGCSSGKNTFERGNYYEAVLTSVNRLRRNSDHKKSTETLRQAYPMAVTFYEDQAKTSLSSAEKFKWSEVVKSYTAINTMYDEIKRCPGALRVIPDPINYFDKLQEARRNAAEENYAAGILALQLGGRESAKQAYGYFKIANDYSPGYKEVNDYLQAALSAATVKIVVEPIPVHSKGVGVSAEFFNDKISEFIHSAPINEFVKFYTRAEAQKTKVNPDHIIQLEFDEFTVGQIYKHEKEIQLTKDSIVLGSYANGPAPSNQGSTTGPKTTASRTGLVTTGKSPVVASPQTAVNSAPKPAANNPTPTQSESVQALAEKQRREQEQRDKELAEKARAEREAMEKQRLAQEAADKERAAIEAAQKQRAEEAAAQIEKAAKEAADKALAEKLATEKEQGEKEYSERQRAEKERAETELAAKAKADQVERERAEKEKSEHEKLAKEKAEKEKADKEKAEKEKAEKEKADKEKAEKEKVEKEKAEREQANKERVAKEKNEKEKYADPLIKSEDTLNVTDPVMVCHIPPGNHANARSLRINRSALKAHLAHGDIEGGCDKDTKEPKNKQGGDDDKGRPDTQEVPNGKPQDDKKGKGNKGTGRLQLQTDYEVLFHEPVLWASSDTDHSHLFHYLPTPVVQPDTNKIYGTVKATLYHYTKTTTSKGIVSFRIIDAKTGALLSVQKMPGEFVWRSEWATFNGDERALSPAQLTLTKQKELPPPAPQDLFIEFTRPIYDQITTKLKDFYKGY